MKTSFAAATLLIGIAALLPACAVRDPTYPSHGAAAAGGAAGSLPDRPAPPPAAVAVAPAPPPIAPAPAPAVTIATSPKGDGTALKR